MILTIDKKRIDFTLENERFLNEVIESINYWLSDNQLIIEKLYINNEDYSQKDLNIKLDNINIIDIETLSFRDLNINNLTWIKFFFEKLVNGIEKWDQMILSQIKKELPFVLNHLPVILSLDNSAPEESYNDLIIEMMEKYNYFKYKEEDVNKTEAISILNNIIILLNERIKEYTDTKEELLKSIGILATIKPDLGSVSIFLQSGKSIEASNIMDKFFRIFHKILRILNFNLKNSELISNNRIDDFTQGLDDILGELVEGYESQDLVLIGDILEYEICPRVEILEKIFN